MIKEQVIEIVGEFNSLELGADDLQIPFEDNELFEPFFDMEDV